MLNDVHQQRAVARGIETYVQVLAERKQVAPAVLAEVTYIPSPAYPNSSDDADVCSAYALLLSCAH